MTGTGDRRGTYIVRQGQKGRMVMGRAIGEGAALFPAVSGAGFVRRRRGMLDDNISFYSTVFLLKLLCNPSPKYIPTYLVFGSSKEHTMVDIFWLPEQIVFKHIVSSKVGRRESKSCRTISGYRQQTFHKSAKRDRREKLTAQVVHPV